MEYLLINLYNKNTAPEQFKILESLSKVLKDFQDISGKNIIFAGDIHLLFDQKLFDKNLLVKPNIQKLAVSKLIEFKESLDLGDMWRIRNPKSKIFTL